jgi:hypothetical protein
MYVFHASGFVNGVYTTRDCLTSQEAIARVESWGGGSVVKFRKERNLPNCLPEYVLRSLAMWTFDDGQWWSHYIFDGHGEKVAQEKPE